MENNIFVDPTIITTPSEDDSRENVVAWIDVLTLWLREALSSHRQWFHLVQATDLLLNEQRFPSFEILRAWQRKYKIDINPSFLLRDVNAFFRDEQLDLSKKLENLGYLVEAEENTIAIHPPQFSSRWLECIYEEMQHLFITACACKHTQNTFGKSLLIATPLLEGEKREIVVSAIIKDAIPDFTRNADNTITEIFPLLFTPEDLPLLDVMSLWKRGEQGIRKAIEQQYIQDWANRAKQLPYKLGSHFITSINEKSEMTELLLNQIIKTMTRVIANKTQEGKHDRHEVRESEVSGTPQLTRASDNAKAWRITLTTDGAGWRMHYWQIPGGEAGDSIEFSNVLTKHDAVRIY